MEKHVKESLGWEEERHDIYLATAKYHEYLIMDHEW
jgi:hypothetical protein